MNSHYQRLPAPSSNEFIEEKEREVKHSSGSLSPSYDMPQINARSEDTVSIIQNLQEESELYESLATSIAQHSKNRIADFSEDYRISSKELNAIKDKSGLSLPSTNYTPLSFYSDMTILSNGDLVIWRYNSGRQDYGANSHYSLIACSFNVIDKKLLRLSETSGSPLMFSTHTRSRNNFTVQA